MTKDLLTSLCLSFAASQVDKIQFGGSDVFFPTVVSITALQMYGED